MMPELVVAPMLRSTARSMKSPGARSVAPRVSRLKFGLPPAAGIDMFMIAVLTAPWLTTACALKLAPAVIENRPRAASASAASLLHHHRRRDRRRGGA